jgi:hypothetical protein
MPEDASRSRERIPRGVWVVPLVVIASIDVIAFTGTRGWCADSGSPDVPSVCGSEPIFGWPGTWVIAVLSVIAAGYCVWRIVRPPRRGASR